jgi:hypothetical protein
MSIVIILITTEATNLVQENQLTHIWTFGVARGPKRAVATTKSNMPPIDSPTIAPTGVDFFESPTSFAEVAEERGLKILDVPSIVDVRAAVDEAAGDEYFI